MSAENMKVSIESATDLLQIITEDLEENFIRSVTDNDVKARASMTLSSLYILSDFLTMIAKGAAV